jgi:hypothetical protein
VLFGIFMDGQSEQSGGRCGRDGAHVGVADSNGSVRGPQTAVAQCPLVQRQWRVDRAGLVDTSSPGCWGR